MVGPSLSIIIPARNEGDRIVSVILAAQQAFEPLETIVVDGQSNDDTTLRAAQHARVLQAPPGRALQMNYGAKHAFGEVLLFLHADTYPSPHAAMALRDALASTNVEAGVFRLKFDRTSPWLNFYSRCTHINAPMICFGDRGLFVRRSVFEAIGGFPLIPVFEDLELVRTLYRRGKFRFLDAHVTTSARRFKSKGDVRQQLVNFMLWSGYLLGLAPSRLARFYPYK